MRDHADAALDRAFAVIGDLAGDIGPRRPTGAAEARAAERVAGWFTEAGLTPALEPFRGPATFAWAQAVAPTLALLGRVGSAHAAGRALAALALVAAATEANPRLQPLTRITSTGHSRNVVAAIEPAGEALRTLCLVCHLDSSRSGLLFHPRLASHLRSLITATSLALAARAVAVVADGRRGWAKPLGRASAAVLGTGLALLAEREIRGQDVPGANDNASGVAAVVAIGAGLARRPLGHTRVVLLATGCEESGTVGMRSFLERHDTSGWIFLNLDGVGAPATLRYLPREGVGRTWPADPGLVRIADDLERHRPELGLARAERLVGLTYDATQVLARGGRALTLSAQDETIPNYHTPNDTPARIDPDVLGRAIETVRELAAAVDRGEADWGF